MGNQPVIGLRKWILKNISWNENHVRFVPNR